jgi:glycosyltransferase involved in cell wall biosynthesis
MDLLKAYETIAKKHQVALVYVGDGELRQSLEQYARDKGLSQVHFAGFQNQTEIPRYFALADIFVLPSIRESWGLVVNEALCFGLPVVISNQVGAADDLVRDNVNGFIFEAANPAALAEKLDRILADDALRERMGEASKNLIAGWDMQEDVRGILSGLKQILG